MHVLRKISRTVVFEAPNKELAVFAVVELEFADQVVSLLDRVVRLVDPVINKLNQLSGTPVHFHLLQRLRGLTLELLLEFLVQLHVDLIWLEVRLGVKLFRRVDLHAFFDLL